MLKLVFLTNAFFERYSGCNEIEQKPTRPYARIQICVNGITWAIPLRSHIRHTYAVWTDKINGCGIDLTKAVVIDKPDEYIDGRKPQIRQNEFEAIKRINKGTVERKFEQYISDYKKAKANTEIQRNANLVKFSTLQYFEEYL